MEILRVLFLWKVIFLISNVAFANIQVFPTRINLSPKNKTSTVVIRLRSDKPETFRVSTMFYEMAKDGSLKQRPELTRSSESAAPFIQFSPKRITLRPNVEQVVRIRAKNISKLKGEVRTHLYFRPEEKTTHDPIKKSFARKSTFELKAQIAVAVPVVITPKAIDKDYSLSDFRLFPSKEGLKFKVGLLNRTPGYLYGDVSVYKMNGKKKTKVAYAKGVSSYVRYRSISYPLQSKGKLSLAKGKYRLVFNEYSQFTPKQGNVKSIDYFYR